MAKIESSIINISIIINLDIALLNRANLFKRVDVLKIEKNLFKGVKIVVVKRVIELFSKK